MKYEGGVRFLILVLSIIFVLVSIFLIFIFAPSHEIMGDVQRIFYFHVGSAWVSYLAFGVTFIASLLYLKSKNLKWDTIAFNSAEIGIIFCTLAITTGPLWGKAVWGTYWKWEDLKLFMTLVLWLIFIAYLALRANAKSKIIKANLSAVFGIIGFFAIPLSLGANRIWQQYHPTVIATSQGSLQSSMGFTLGISVIALTFLYFYLLLTKIEVDKMNESIDKIKQKIGD